MGWEVADGHSSNIKLAQMRGSVVGQAHLAHCVTWLDPIDDGEMVQQSVATGLQPGWCRQTCRINIAQMGIATVKVQAMDKTVIVTTIMSTDKTMGVDVIALEYLWSS